MLHCDRIIYLIQEKMDDTHTRDVKLWLALAAAFRFCHFIRIC